MKILRKPQFHIRIVCIELTTGSNSPFPDFPFLVSELAWKTRYLSHIFLTLFGITRKPVVPKNYFEFVLE